MAIAAIERLQHTGSDHMHALINRGEFALYKAGMVLDRSSRNEHVLHRPIKAALGVMNRHINEQDQWRTVNGEIFNPLSHITGLDADELRMLLHEAHTVGVVGYADKKMGDRIHPVVAHTTSQATLRGYTALSVVASEYRKRRWYDSNSEFPWEKVVEQTQHAIEGLQGSIQLTFPKDLQVPVKALREGNERHQKAFMKDLQYSARALPDFGLVVDLLHRRS